MQDEPNKKTNRAKDDENLLFARGEVIRLMKDHLDKDKMITERVKVEMNRFLSNVLVAVCEELNKYPYTTIDYEMLKESTYPYTRIKQINQERERILVHLNAIKADCDALGMDIEKTLKLNESDGEDSDFVPHTSRVKDDDSE